MIRVTRRQTRGQGRGALLGMLLSSTVWSGVAWAQQIPTGSSARNEELNEVVITAEKRASTVQDTPISITALSGEQLQERGTTGLTGIIAEVPGISMRTSGPGQTELEMRGLASSGGSSPTVGFYLDEVPLSPPAADLTGKVVIDPDLFDLNRVEVLRGPQGTLYGSGSMGGTVKLVTNQPDLRTYQGNFLVSLSDTPAGGVNPGANFMVNLPLIDDKLALRLVVTDKFTSGWIDREVVGNFPLPTNCPSFCFSRGNVAAAPVLATFKNVNFEHLQAGRAALAFKPNEDFSMNTLFMFQGLHMGGPSTFDQSYGQSGGSEIHFQPANVKEPFSDSFGLLATTLTYNLGFADLTSSSSYWHRDSIQSQDSNEELEQYFAAYFAAPQFQPSSYVDKNVSSQFSQEIRVASKDSSRFTWLAGAYYSQLQSVWEDNNLSPSFAGFDGSGAAANPTGVIYNAHNPYHIVQYAVFGETSYKVTDRLKVTAGARWYDFNSKVTQYETGILGSSTFTLLNPVTAAGNTSASGINPKVNISYEPSADLLVYATAAEGYRPGGFSLPVPGGLGCTLTNPAYRPDTAWNFETGEKARFLDNHLTVNADIYYITWSGVQQAVNQNCGYPVTVNAGNAHAYGPEVEINAKVTSNITLTLSGAYTNASLDSVNPTVTAADPLLAKGSPILNIPKLTESAALTYVTPVNSTYDFSARLTNSYVGSSTDLSWTYEKLPSYDMVDLRFGLIGSVYSGYLYANNLTDTRPRLSINTTAFAWNTPTTVRVATSQPRTFGIDFNYRF